MAANVMRMRRGKRQYIGGRRMGDASGGARGREKEREDDMREEGLQRGKEDEVRAGRSKKDALLLPSRPRAQLIITLRHSESSTDRSSNTT